MTRPSVVLLHSPVLGPASVQPTATALSARGWICLVPALGGDTVEALVAAGAAATPTGAVVVAHSGAGPLVPAVTDPARGRAPAGAVFLDARLPAAAGATAMAEPAMVDFLSGMAVDGWVPPWWRWWGEDTYAELVADPGLADALRAEMRELPLELFRSEVAPPPGWSDVRCAFVRLSAAYDAEAADARGRGWPVVVHSGSHLDPATRPDAVADLLDTILAGWS